MSAALPPGVKSRNPMKQNFKNPQLLYTYLATEMLAPFFASFLIMNCVFFLVKLIPFLNFVLELQIDFSDFTRLFSYLFPNIFLYSIPMSAMMGVTIGFARLSSDSEILALKASGISMYKIIPPVVIVTAIIALFTAYFSMKLIPLSEIAMKQLTYQLLKEKVNKGIKPHVFTEALGDVVVYVDQIDKETGNWSDVWVSDMRGVENPVITMASSGHMESDIQDMNVTIVLQNGSLHKPSNESAQIVEFDQYKIHIPLSPPNSKATQVKKRNVLTMGELLQESKDERVPVKEQRTLLIEFHKRMVLPAGCLLISLIGLPLGLQARPGKKAIGIQAGLGIFIIYYIFFTIGKSMAEKATLPVAVAMWGPNLFFFCLAVFWIYRVSNEQTLVPAILSENLVKLFTAIKRFFAGLVAMVKNRFGIVQRDHDDDEDAPLLPGAIRGNAKSRVFHVPGCEYYTSKNCSIEFKNIQIALDSGFEPCRFCKNKMELP
ncbi:LPS export ABC transporter permease LptF [Desulforhopalus sp. IMCC35007]|nr:LPS export ABC transporter permease LptF [Desulforhopalus sp. IMCC35007]